MASAVARIGTRALSGDEEEDLRAYFTNALATETGDRSSLGAALERARLKLPLPTTSDADMDAAYDRWRFLSRRMDRVRRRLLELPRAHVDVLRVFYSPVPIGRVLGLVTKFDGREYAAVAVAQVEAPGPGVSQWEALNDLRKRADGQKAGDKAFDELRGRRESARGAVAAAQAAYVWTGRIVRDAERAERRERHERALVGLGVTGGMGA